MSAALLMMSASASGSTSGSGSGGSAFFTREREQEHVRVFGKESEREQVRKIVERTNALCFIIHSKHSAPIFGWHISDLRQFIKYCLKAAWLFFKIMTNDFAFPHCSYSF